MYGLIVNSPVFKNMFIVGKGEGASIQLDHPASVIEDFLDTVYVTKPKTILRDLEFRRGLALLHFVDPYGAETMQEQLLERLLAVAKDFEAFDVLVYASDRDDWSLATRAVNSIKYEPVHHARHYSRPQVPHVIQPTIEYYIERLSPAMQMALLKAIVYKGISLDKSTNWQTVSEGFVKKAPRQAKRRWVQRPTCRY